MTIISKELLHRFDFLCFSYYSLTKPGSKFELLLQNFLKECTDENLLYYSAF